jgi:hypothetical protein
VLLYQQSLKGDSIGAEIQEDAKKEVANLGQAVEKAEAKVAGK